MADAVVKPSTVTNGDSNKHKLQEKSEKSLKLLQNKENCKHNDTIGMRSEDATAGTSGSVVKEVSVKENKDTGGNGEKATSVVPVKMPNVSLPVTNTVNVLPQTAGVANPALQHVPLFINLNEQPVKKQEILIKVDYLKSNKDKTRDDVSRVLSFGSKEPVKDHKDSTKNHNEPKDLNESKHGKTLKVDSSTKSNKSISSSASKHEPSSATKPIKIESVKMQKISSSSPKSYKNEPSPSPKHQKADSYSAKVLKIESPASKSHKIDSTPSKPQKLDSSTSNKIKQDSVTTTKVHKLDSSAPKILKLDPSSPKILKVESAMGRILKVDSSAVKILKGEMSKDSNRIIKVVSVEKVHRVEQSSSKEKVETATLPSEKNKIETLKSPAPKIPNTEEEIKIVKVEISPKLDPDIIEKQPKSSTKIERLEIETQTPPTETFIVDADTAKVIKQEKSTVTVEQSIDAEILELALLAEKAEKSDQTKISTPVKFITPAKIEEVIKKELPTPETMECQTKSVEPEKCVKVEKVLENGSSKKIEKQDKLQTPVKKESSSSKSSVLTNGVKSEKKDEKSRKEDRSSHNRHHHSSSSHHKSSSSSSHRSSGSSTSKECSKCYRRSKVKRENTGIQCERTDEKFSTTNSEPLNFKPDPRVVINRDFNCSRANLEHLKYGKFFRIEVHPNGGASTVHLYQDEISVLNENEMNELVDEFFSVTFGEDENGFANHVMGIVHDGASHLPDLLEHMAENYSSLTVKAGVLGRNSDIETCTMSQYNEQVIYSTWIFHKK